MMGSQARKPARKSDKTTKNISNSEAKSAKKPLNKAKAMQLSKASEDKDEQVEIRIPADARWVRLVRLAAAGVASVLQFSVEEIEDIKLAVAEACNNAILHAQPVHSAQGQELPTVVVTLKPARDYLEIWVEDQGRVAQEIVSPTQKTRTSELSSDALPEGGLGLLIIQTVMDEVRYLTGDNMNTTLCMVKYRHLPDRQAGRQVKQ